MPKRILRGRRFVVVLFAGEMGEPVYTPYGDFGVRG